FGGDCCSGLCDPSSGCVSVPGMCSGAGAPCLGATDCCSVSCVSGQCTGSACVADNAACASDAECCGGSCKSGACAPLNTACKTAGNPCAASGDCCSGLCGADQLCSQGGSFCIQPGDACTRDGDCCAANCVIAAGSAVGTCAEPPKGPSYCSGVDGTLCGSCNDCCSRLCAPSPAGINICQPASGCHVTGDLCLKDTDCCGGDATSGLPGAGNGQCALDPSGKIGICTNPVNGGSNACNPEGNVCHYLADNNYMCSSSAARSDCCGPLTPKSQMCLLDGLGVPRCLGVGSCQAAGATCASAADCCDKLPCVPDATGALHCLVPPDGGQACVPTGGSCTINADCCPGGLCNRPRGSSVGSCASSTPPPPGTGGAGGYGGNGGTSGTGGAPGGCALYGQLCSMDSDCCNGVPCTGGDCVYSIVK
ncbi:MAG TPA: hypothetical protein VGM29_15075, partial [Polyangiaceae bacterium]